MQSAYIGIPFWVTDKMVPDPFLTALSHQGRSGTLYWHQEKAEPGRVTTESRNNSCCSSFIFPTFIRAIYFLLMPLFSLPLFFALNISGEH